MHNAPHYLEPLNPEQKQAVLHTGKPLLILAGAGSGKTRVITTKIAWLIGEQGMDPRSILAVTFTNKAAREMAQRAMQIEPRAEYAMLRTFHSFGAWFLRRNGELAGLDSSFVIYDDDDVVSLLSGLMENAPKLEVRETAHNISRAKDYFLSPADSSPHLLNMIIPKNNSHKIFLDVYARYEERMAQIGNVDFGDLIKKPAEILRANPEVARRFQDRFKVIMVDEYQDANVAQFHLLKELCGPETYVCVVGDDDQSIYRFRGAEVKNILEFPVKFPDAQIIRLESNYRSTSPILRAASSVVDYNHGRLGKTLRAEKGNGKLPVLLTLANQDMEAGFCAEQIKNSVNKKETAWSDWAILYRTNAQSLGFETEFLRKGIPYRVVGSLKFYEREEIKDALALLSLLVNPRDEVAFRRVVNKPARGIGSVSVDKVINAAILDGTGDLLNTGNNIELSKKAREGLNQFVNVIKDAEKILELITHDDVQQNDKKTITKNKSKKKGSLVYGAGLSHCVERLVVTSGIAEYHEMQDEVTGNSKLSNLQELINAASEYPQSREGLLGFLEDIELDRSLTEKKDNDSLDTVTLITFHNTKGLEFRRVIMTGLEQGIFPREDKKGDELEEERRLFYVGATRAMDELYLTNCQMRRMYGRTMPAQPSIFLQEIDKSVIQEDKRNVLAFGRQIQNAPGVFNPFNITPSVNSGLEEQAGYKKGQRIFHDNYGYGAVMSVTDSEDGPLVYVRFDNGGDKRFLSEYQSRAYEKIYDE